MPTITPRSEGDLDGCVLADKVHLWALDPTSGDSIDPITERLWAHPVLVVHERIEVDPDPSK